MFIGHFGLAFAAKKADSKVNMSWLCIASMLPDIVLWTLVLLNAETVKVPAGYERLHYLRFIFPYSHSLAGITCLSIVAAITSFAVFRNRKAGLVTLALIFLHFVLDVIVHEPGLPLLGTDSMKLGLGLWNNILASFITELALLVGGLILYERPAHTVKGFRRYIMWAFMIVIAACSFAGQYYAPPPSSVPQVALSSLVMIPVVCFFAGLIDKMVYGHGFFSTSIN